MKIIKRSGEEAEFDLHKIESAITRAFQDTPDEPMPEREELNIILNKAAEILYSMNHSPHVEEIQDLVEDLLMDHNYKKTAKSYIKYRFQHELTRKKNSTDDQIMSLLARNNEEIKQENSNKNPIINSVQRDYMAGEVSKDISRRYLIPHRIMEAHDQGIIHFHDLDYFAQRMYNCCLVNLEDMLQNGTVISETMIEKPHSFATACNIATQIIAQVASSQYGGQSITLSHLAPFVDISRKAIRKDVEQEFLNEEMWRLYTENKSAQTVYELTESEKEAMDAAISRVTESRLYKEIKKGIQTIQYQIITLMTTNGQAPFVTVFMYLNEVQDPQTKADLALMIEETLKQRIQGVKNEKGVFITPAFPKLIYVLEEDNIHKNSPYYYLTELAAKCTASRMVPDYISEKIMKQLKVDDNGEGQCYPCMGCRSFLTPYTDKDGNPKYYGRFNQGVVTLNLVDCALSSHQNEEDFWKILDERLQLCYDALMIRHKHLKGVISDSAPILWQHGAIARLKPGETIDKLLYGNYSTISLGYAGLYECVKYMTGVSHTDPEGTAFGKRVMERLNAACASWRASTNISFSLYGTPMESTTYKFAKKLQNRFGIIEGITSKNYITNSYHVHVTEEIDAFHKLEFESEFQKLSPGGAISYVETPNMTSNIQAVLSVMQFIYDKIMYAELNTKSDYCKVCGYSGEIPIVTNADGKLVFECPVCHNTDEKNMNVARRTCGYIGTQYWNQGRTQEIKDRVTHL